MKKTADYSRFDNLKPSTVTSSAARGFSEKVAAANPGVMGADLMGLAGGLGGGGGVLRNPSRRFYDPEFSTTAIFLPKNRREVNRWCRYFYDHDEIIGAVLDLHAELPHSRAEVMCEDTVIKRQVEDCIDNVQLFSKLPGINLEFLKIGEVFINTPWDADKGMWKAIVVHNPDFVEVSASPFAEDQYVIELLPDDQLKKLINSTKPQDLELKKRLPQEIIRRVLSGKNIELDPAEITHIARKSNPYDVRGKSILQRCFRLLMYEDKLREAQITIADNFIYPLKIFKLGDPQQGWIPDSSHQQELAAMLQQANFDPNFALIYHYALSVDYVTVADKIMKLDNEWDEINKKKMMALGVNQEFLTGGSAYASANVGLQTQLARYKATRDLFEGQWLRNKFLKGMAEKNEWYRRDKRELTGQYRITRSSEEQEQRLIIPKFVWHKKLMLRDDQAFLTFLNNVYAQGKGPVSALTLLQYCGLDIEDELNRKKLQKELENKIGAYIQPPSAIGAPGVGPTPPPVSAISKLWKKVAGDKKAELADIYQQKIELAEQDNALISGATDLVQNGFADALGGTEDVAQAPVLPVGLSYSNTFDKKIWDQNLKSKYLEPPVVSLLKGLEQLESYPDKKHRLEEIVDKLYRQGKLYSYNKTKFIPYNENIEQEDWSDRILISQMHNWVSSAITDTKNQDCRFKAISLNAFCQGQLKGYQEQGVEEVILTNALKKNGQKFTITSLLNKGEDLPLALSSLYEAPIFIPIIHNNEGIDPQIQKDISFYVDNTKINNCPIELIDDVKSFVKFLGALKKKAGKKSPSTISFVNDIVDSPEWETTTKQEIQTSLPETEDAMLKNLLLTNRLAQTKAQNRNFIPLFETEDALYISKWVIDTNKPFITSMLNDMNYVTETLNKQIQKSFDTNLLDLSKQEIETYLMLGCIVPAAYNNVSGYMVNEDINKDVLDSKLTEGKVWDSQGQCLLKHTVDPSQLFQENVERWILLPHTLAPSIEKFFSNIFQ